MTRVLSLLVLSVLSIALSGCGCMSSCCTFFNPDSKDEELIRGDGTAGYEVINSAPVTSIVQNLAVDAKHKQHLRLEQAKSYYDGGLKTIQLEFISQDIIEMCEARELIVDLTENLLAKLNQDPVLAGDFVSYPFTPCNLEIYITFESYFGKYVDCSYIRWIGLEDDMVTYYTFDLIDNVKNRWHSRRETYATSREIVVYEREAEREYAEVIANKMNIFGDQRYYPKQ